MSVMRERLTGFAGGIQAQHQQAHLFGAKELAQGFGELRTHRGGGDRSSPTVALWPRLKSAREFDLRGLQIGSCSHREIDCSCLMVAAFKIRLVRAEETA